MKDYKNPIIPNSAEGNTSDPYVIRHNGMYYHCYSNGKGVYVCESDKLWNIGSGKKKLVYNIESENKPKHWYAPELHHINGKWYIYASPDYGNNLHVMTVLECSDESPMGEYKNLGMVKGLENKWSIDGTVLNHKGQLYFIWAGDERILMAQMSDPCTITDKVITITKPEYAFETICGKINEGPAVLKRGDKIHIVYSANDSMYDEYCLGLLTCFADKDVMDIKNWQKAEFAVFKKTDEIFGPGHCSFTTVTEDEKEIDYVVYHANLVSGTGWRGRSVFIKPIEWDKEDMPIFGEPQF